MYNLFMNSSLGFLLQILPFVFLVGAIYLIFRLIYLKRRNLSNAGAGSETLRLLSVCYFTSLLSLVWTPVNFWNAIWFRILNGYPGGSFGQMFSGEFNFTSSVFRYLSGEFTGGGWIYLMFIGNMLLFVPLGFLLPFLVKKSVWWKIILLGLVVSLVIELGQPIFGRNFDTDDLILNTFGTAFGYVFYAFIRLLFPKFIVNFSISKT